MLTSSIRHVLSPAQQMLENMFLAISHRFTSSTITKVNMTYCSLGLWRFLLLSRSTFGRHFILLLGTSFWLHKHTSWPNLHCSKNPQSSQNALSNFTLLHPPSNVSKMNLMILHLEWPNWISWMWMMQVSHQAFLTLQAVLRKQSPSQTSGMGLCATSLFLQIQKRASGVFVAALQYDTCCEAVSNVS